ncbi:MAG: Cys-Gln thioester bond-forming surface protein [Bacilli bacterium]|nr:Cys-Gln thioester bond-forming surface protein [Bacilli bacterium]
MKRFKFITFMMILAAFLFGGIIPANAETILPETFVTHKDDRQVLNYIKYVDTAGNNDDYALYAKKSTDGTFVYCIDLHKYYDGNKTYTKTGTLDEGIVYILKNRPHTNDAGYDFYVTQMAVYFYQDWLHNNNYNLQEPFKKLIKLAATVEGTNLDATTIKVSKDIYKLWYDATEYRQKSIAKDGYINITSDSVKFTEQDGYFVSSKIYLKSGNLNGDMKKTMINATPNTRILRDTADGGYVVKIPVTDIPEGKKVTFTLKWEGNYNKEYAYYYFTDDSHQRLLYDKLEVKSLPVEAKITLTVKNYIENYQVKISKTDVTQQQEVPGATLVVKDAKGNVVDTWVSTTETHKMILAEGEYSLTETIAPAGYRLSTTTIYFKLDADGKLYAKVNGNYVLVEKINMINELKDVTSIAKKDKVTDKYLPGAVLVVKDSQGNVVKEFTSNDSVYQLILQPGEYTLEEKAAPSGYILSKEVVSFKVLVNGALQVKNSNGVYEDSVMVVFYNTPEKKETVPVPNTGVSGMLLTIAGITLLVSGVVYVIKTTKEC